MQVVVAIDFGTSRTGYAFAFLENNPGREVFPRLDWPHQPVPYVKTLSDLLYDPDGKLVAWGFAAQHALTQTKNDPQRHQYKYLVNYKMQLKEGRPGPRGPEFDHPSGETFAVVDLIADYLGELRRLVIGDLERAGTGAVAESEILWCMTVPAIWLDVDKQVMRIAAEKAGLITRDSSDRLIFALEPEAAALYCNEKDGAVGRSELEPGTRFMVVDAGGGTVDLTIHEVGQGGLIEVVPGSGGECGSKYLDGRFSDYIEELLGKENINRLWEDEPAEALELLRHWERIKCAHTGEGDSTAHITISRRFGKILDEPGNATYVRRLAERQGGDTDNIHLDPATMRKLFAPVLEQIGRTVRDQFRALGRQKCDYLFLVGGFAASPALQRMIKEEFGRSVQKVVVPPEPGKAVVWGAALYGLDQKRILARRSRYTYGCRVRALFIPGTDPESKKVREPHNDVDRCDGVFDVFVTAGDLIAVDHTVRRTYYPVTPTQTSMEISLHKTEKTQVRHTDEPHVSPAGSMEVKMPDLNGGAGRSVEVIMYFGRTEIRVEAVDKTSGERAQTSVNFMSTL